MMHTTAPTSRFLHWLLTTPLCAWAYQCGYTAAELAYTDIREEREERERNCYAAGKRDAERGLDGKLRRAYQDGRRKGRAEAAPIYGCSHHGDAIAPLREMTHGHFVCPQCVPQIAPAVFRDTDGVIPRAIAEADTARRSPLRHPDPRVMALARPDGAPPPTNYGIRVPRPTLNLRKRQ